MSAFFLAGAGTSAGRQGAKLGLYCSAWGSSCLCQLFSLFVSFFQLRVKVLRCRLGLRRCKRTERVSLSGRILGAQSLVLGSSVVVGCAGMSNICIFVYIYILCLQVNASSVSKRVNPNLAPKPLVLCWGPCLRLDVLL